jgi:hypothetical protein
MYKEPASADVGLGRTDKHQEARIESRALMVRAFSVHHHKAKLHKGYITTSSVLDDLCLRVEVGLQKK